MGPKKIAFSVLTTRGMKDRAPHYAFPIPQLCPLSHVIADDRAAPNVTRGTLCQLGEELVSDSHRFLKRRLAAELRTCTTCRRLGPAR